MELLLSNFEPLKFKDHCNLSGCFNEFVPRSDHIKIACGYVSEESLIGLKDIVKNNGFPKLDLLIGMHYFDGITKTQYETAQELDSFLTAENLGGVHVAKVFKFHGKMYSFNRQNHGIAGIIGSSNLNNILGKNRQYEVDCLITKKPHIDEISRVISETIRKIGIPLSEWQPLIIQTQNQLLSHLDDVSRVDEQALNSIKNRCSSTVFNIPLRVTQKQGKSNLNIYFGKGRKSTSGYIAPRPWYEVEIIVETTIANDKNYPKVGTNSSEFDVYTDDGWNFKCQISGANNKNFRSKGDLLTLGKWIKGRLENAGVLSVGEMVTEDTLRKYGRSDLQFVATDDPKIWFLNFGVDNE